MAVVNGVKEKLQFPLHDSVKVNPEEQLGDSQKSSTLKFFVDVQGKTKLETNLQSAGLLPHYNTFEARAMRVVISDLPAQFPDEPTATSDDFPVTDDDGRPLLLDGNGNIILGNSALTTETPTPPPPQAITGS